MDDLDKVRAYCARHGLTISEAPAYPPLAAGRPCLVTGIDRGVLSVQVAEWRMARAEPFPGAITEAIEEAK
jgi:hypothetical protein